MFINLINEITKPHLQFLEKKKTQKSKDFILSLVTQSTMNKKCTLQSSPF